MTALLSREGGAFFVASVIEDLAIAFRQIVIQLVEQLLLKLPAFERLCLRFITAALPEVHCMAADPHLQEIEMFEAGFPLRLILFRHWAADFRLTRLKVDNDVIRMRNRMRYRLTQLAGEFDLLFPRGLVVDSGFETVVLSFAAFGLNRPNQFGDLALREAIPLHRLDSHRPEDRLNGRKLNCLIALSDQNRAIGFLQK